jgi:hypothetical protein
MKFNHYETLVNLVLGYLLLIVLMLGLSIDYDNKFTAPYLAGAYVIGYMLNALSSFLEPIYYWTIGGMPSNQLLTVLTNKDYSGIKKVKFYRTQEVIDKLKSDLHDPNPSKGKMFGAAMSYSNNRHDTRVPAFNAQYAFSREILTLIFIIAIIIIAKEPSCWFSYISLPVLLLAWNRYKERGYYYAKEVLTEYLKK